MDIIGGIGSVIDLVRKAKELADKLKNLEMKEVIVDLQGQLIDLKEQIVALREENVQLKAEARKLALPPELTLKDGAYYTAVGEGPFCTGCYDGRQKLHRLAEQTGPFRQLSKWRCPVCKTNYGEGNW